MNAARKNESSDTRSRKRLFAAILVLLLSLGWLVMYSTSGRSSPPSDPSLIDAAMRENAEESERLQRERMKNFPGTGHPAGQTVGS